MEGGMVWSNGRGGVVHRVDHSFEDGTRCGRSTFGGTRSEGSDDRVTCAQCQSAGSKSAPRSRPAPAPTMDDLEMLRRGAVPWNESRRHQPKHRPDLSRVEIWSSHGFRGGDIRPLFPNPGGDLRTTNWKGIDFSRCNLSWAQIDGADMEGADLSGADLRCAEFTESNLQNCTLATAKLAGVRMVECDLRGTDFGETAVDDVTFVESLYDRSTVWPTGFHPRERSAAHAREHLQLIDVDDPPRPRPYDLRHSVVVEDWPQDSPPPYDEDFFLLGLTRHDGAEALESALLAMLVPTDAADSPCLAYQPFSGVVDRADVVSRHDMHKFDLAGFVVGDPRANVWVRLSAVPMNSLSVTNFGRSYELECRGPVWTCRKFWQK